MSGNYTRQTFHLAWRMAVALFVFGCGSGAVPGGEVPPPTQAVEAEAVEAPSPGMSPGVSPGPSPGMSPGVSPGPSSGVSPGPSPGMSPGMSPGPSPPAAETAGGDGAAFVAGSVEGREDQEEAGDLCDSDGWCRPYGVLPFSSAAATREAVAVAIPSGVVALWADGRWRGGYTAAAGSEVVAVTREGDAVRVRTCREGRCEARVWAGAAFGPAERGSGGPVAPGRRSKLGEWEVAYSTVRGVGSDGQALKLRPTTALGRDQCATELYLLGDADAPFAVCRQYTAQSLHHVEGDRLVTLTQPWATTWVNGGAAVHVGAGCAPCLVTIEGILSRHDHAWEVAPMPPGAAGALTDSSLPPYVSIARDGEALSVRIGHHTWTWNGGWARSEREGPWAGRVEGSAWESGSELYSTADAQLVLAGGNGVVYRRWDRLMPEGAPLGGLATVHGVAPDDVLYVRAGPHAASTSLATLSPGACVQEVDATSRISGRTWQALALPDGRRGWVNARYLRPDPACTAPGAVAAPPSP